MSWLSGGGFEVEEIKSRKNSHKNLKSPFYEDFKSPSTKTFPQRVRTEGSLYYDAIQKPLRHPPLIIAIKNKAVSLQLDHAQPG